MSSAVPGSAHPERSEAESQGQRRDPSSPEASTLAPGACAAPERGAIDSWAREDLQALQARGLRRHLEALSSPQGALIQIGAETLVNFSSNDYLGLAKDPRLAQVAAAALAKHGVGTGASRLIAGDTMAHRALEAKVAAFMGSDSALLFNSGYAANVGVLSALCQKGDVVFSDELNHASLIDGCRLSHAKTLVYPHRDLKGLELLMHAVPGRRRVVCTDAVFSMDGDWAPLGELVALCREHDVGLIVDEAHALGVLGKTGAGLCEELGVVDDVDVRVGTMGKSLGAFGAFAAASKNITELLFNRARSLVFSTSLPAALCAAGGEALDLLTSENELRARLWKNIHHFADGLRTLGYPAQAQSAIFPIIVGDPDSAIEASRFLRARGLLVKAIRPPTVPAGTSRLRFGLSAAHTTGHLDLALDALRALARTA